MNSDKKPAKNTQIKLPGVVIVILNGKESRAAHDDAILTKVVAS